VQAAIVRANKHGGQTDNSGAGALGRTLFAVDALWTTALGAEARRLARFQDPIQAIVSRGRALDLRGFEIAPVERITGELQPATLDLLGETRKLLGSVLECCEPSVARGTADEAAESLRTSFLTFDRAIDETVATKQIGSLRAVEEIAFMADLELRQRTERLTRVGPVQGAAALLGECDSSLRRIRKALNAVDAAIATAADVPPRLDFASELETSLAVRRAYAKLRARLVGVGEPTAGTMRARIRAVGTQLASCIGWDVYADMRVGDRLVLRDIQRRVLEWLRGENDATPAAGMRLWQDLAGCLEMLVLVNRRQDLVAHDAAVVRDALARLAPQCDVDSATWHRLRELDGLDPELDELLLLPPPPRGLLDPILARLASRLGLLPATATEPSW
jgi:hypothetical protein